jgi:hypothetical protein
MSTIQVKDLTKEFPRSPNEELGGLPWLARMIDKARAHNAGKGGEYVAFPCGGDQRFLGVLGIEPEAFRQQAITVADDAKILEWVKANTTDGWEERLEEYKASQTAPLTGEMADYLAGSKAELAKARPDLDLSKVDNWNRLICAEEGYPLL